MIIAWELQICLQKVVVFIAIYPLQAVYEELTDGSLNRKNGISYNNLRRVLTKRKFSREKINNIEKTGSTTTNVLTNIIIEKGMKQVGKFCREHGILVTLVGNVSALGTALPPFFVFPRVNFKDYMLGNAKPLIC
ncbi:hypothetical protein QYM36_004900 [Artemia franciscana]|uniref:Uncharacterized protein n=1 Tax=Artemia franciscana TaxID=6661 RepID=A0AA88I345_ARTSF|nr:hypothetical protein QYM36_004900 [Artemia franciscana]